MQSTVYNSSAASPRHHSSPTVTVTSRRSRPQQSRSRTASRGESIPIVTNVAPAPPLLRRKTMANDEIINGAKGEDISNGDRHPNSEVNKIRRNSLYMTFNAPQVDDYVCNLILLSLGTLSQQWGKQPQGKPPSSFHIPTSCSPSFP
jgi:hypothetical protein